MIKTEVERLGLIDYASLSESIKLRVNPIKYNLSDADIKFLASCLQSHTSFPEGLSFNRISSPLRGMNEETKQIAAIKLERMGYIDKTIETNNQDGYDYYSYTITELGVDTVIEHEERLRSQEASSLDGFDADVPF